MIVFWLLFIGAIVWLIRSLTGGVSGQNRESQALETLKQRYAKGEVSKKEFDQIKKDINK